MKLTDLRPAWGTWHGETARIEVSFDCPVHGTAHRVHVPFANPLDGGKPVPRNHLWERTGDTFETLTLSPSVNYQMYDNGTVRDLTCWHGYLIDGEIR